MKDKLKDAIDLIAVPEEEKETIFSRITDWQSKKKYSALQRRLVTVTAVLSVILIATNWQRISTVAQSTWGSTKIYSDEWGDEGAWDYRGTSVIANEIVRSIEYTVPQDMETLPCQTQRFVMGEKNGKIYSYLTYDDGKYHYLQKEYASQEQAEMELKTPLLGLDGEAGSEAATTLVICKDMLEKPAILLTTYHAEDKEKNKKIYYLAATVIGGSIDPEVMRVNGEINTTYQETYVTEKGFHAYIYHSRYTQVSNNSFYAVKETDDGGDRQNWENIYEMWYPPNNPLLLPDSYYADIFYEGIHYRLSGATSIGEIKELLESLE